MKFLAFDTSTDSMSVALTDGARVWARAGPGGAKSSATLIPAILALLAEAGMTLDELDAIAFGRGPGSFTGLRTACSVAQGLAFGAAAGTGLQVLPVDTLMALAEEARALATLRPAAVAGGTWQAIALLDARMDEMYVQRLAFDGTAWQSLDVCRLIRPEDLPAYVADGPPDAVLAGNVFEVYASRLPAGLLACGRVVRALPTASAMLRLAPALAAAGHCVDAALALPLYVRDKVALTTEERARIRQQQVRAALPSTADAVNALRI